MNGLVNMNMKKNIPEGFINDFIENSEDYFLTFDNQKLITFINKSYLNALGYTENELLKKNVSYLFFTEDLQGHHNRMKDLFSGKKIRNIIRLKTKNSNSIWVDVLATPIFDNKKNVTGAYCIAYDLTMVKTIESELNVLKQRYDIINELTKDFVYQCDRKNYASEYLAEWASDSFSTLTEFEMDELKQKKCWLFIIHPDDFKKEKDFLYKLIPGDIKESTFRVLTKTGKIKYVKNFVRCTKNDNDDCIKITGVIHDITDWKISHDTVTKNEKFYRSLIETSPYSITLYDLEGNIVLCNQEKLRQLGYSSLEEIKTHNVSDFIHDDFKKIVSEKIKHVITTGENEVLITKMIRKNGSSFIAESRGTLVRDSDDKPLYVLTITSDITDRIENEHLLIEGNNQLIKAMTIGNMGGWRFDFNTKKCLLDKQAIKILDLTDTKFDNTLDMLIELRIPEENKESFRNEVMACLHNVEKQEYDFEIIDSKGNRRYIKSKSELEYGDNKNPIGAIGIIQDKTEEKNLERELKLSFNRLQILDQVKTNLLANMSHEFRTPMTGILGFANLLQEELVNTKYKNAVDSILISSKRLMNTLDAVLELVQLSSDYKLIKSEGIHINQTISQLINENMNKIKVKNLNIDLVNKMNLKIDTDKKLLNNVLSQIMDNAIKFTEKGTIRILIDTENESGALNGVILIEDSGIGIEKQNIEKIFEDFKQISEGLQRKYEGCGLGLSIAKKSVDLIGGKIFVESEVDKGSIFKVLLPNVTIIENEFKENKVENKISKTTEDSLKVMTAKPNILLVEDNLTNKEIVELFIGDLCNLDYAPNGENAIIMCENNKYDAIFMDINLGVGIDGLETTKIIKSLPNYKDTHVIAITGYGSQEYIESIKNLGIEHIISKPFNKSEIIGIIKKIFVK